MTTTNTLIIGASSAGLANAAWLQKLGIDYLLLEKQPHVAHAWRNHYDRLHLHTTKKFSHLPFVPFQPSVPKYPAREDVVAYLEQYQQQMNIHPVFNTEVLSVRREDGHWITRTNGATYQSKNVILATGAAHTPKWTQFEGLDSFPGKIRHSSQYKNGKEFAGQHVLVVGFGNSAGEQAIDLYEHGAYPAMSVRSPVNVLPRDILGISVLQLGLMMRIMPPHISDKVNAPLIRWLVGDINRLGLKKSALGPQMQIIKTGRIPLLDIGTVRLIREGHIRVFDGIDHIEGKTVFFKNGKNASFDAIVLATGYHHALEKILEVEPSVFDDLKKPLDQRPSTGKDGLFCCGYYHTPGGMLREVGLEAEKVAKSIKASLV